MNLGLRNRVAVVTGSSRGIGKAIAYGFAAEEARVTICARNKEEVRETAKEIASSTGAEVLPVHADLKETGDIKFLVKTTAEEFGRIDILVNNTGGPPTSFFVETSEEDWHDAVRSLLMSVVTCCSEVVPYMRQNSWGRLVNMTSFAAKQPADGLVLSNSIRAGIFGLTKTLSNELAEYGILANAVCPGWTWTRRVEELTKKQGEETGRTSEEVINEWASEIPLKRLAQPEEIANLVVFLASEKASYITGAVIQVDGGFIRCLV